MDAVGLDAAGDAGVAGDDDRYARRLRRGHDLFGKGLEGGLVHAVLRQDERGDIAAFEGRGNALGRRVFRRDQHDTAAIGRRGVVHWSSIPVFAYAGRRWLHCGIEQSARFEQAGRRGSSHQSQPGRADRRPG